MTEDHHLMNTPRDKFLEDFKIICEKKSADRGQLPTLRSYKKWFDAPIYKRVLYLDGFADEKKAKLSKLNLRFRKWINSKSMVTSVKIESQKANVQEYDIVTGPKNESYLKYRAEIGVIVTKTSEDAHHFKQYQLHVFEFWKTEDKRYFCKSYMKCVEESDTRGRANTASKNLQTTRTELGNTEYIHSTAEKLINFINDHDENFADELDIDVKLWSQNYKLNKKFNDVRVLRIVHNSPSSTQWWMSQIDTMSTIPEVTLLKNYTGSDSTLEAMPYIVPLEERNVPVWADVISTCDHPIFWARKLTIDGNFENPLSDLSKMSSLGEVNLRRNRLQTTELAAFLTQWMGGQMGHRLERVTIQLDPSFEQNYGVVIKGLRGWDITNDLEGNHEQFTEEFAEAARKDGAEVFLMTRLLATDKRQCSERKISTCSVDKHFEFDGPTSTYGAFALVQLTKSSIHFTAIRNPSFCRELHLLVEQKNSSTQKK
ncbi:hypothetical protein B9Z55_001426 [Caenorhabditis nigoni]|uniref:Uncharacterized protein n=1 Tax=Caenorhabditis nigoni TaxID=1611254 RepID=A0A2G5VFX2_9PELO|nr:hypothetical protein B9Z55_001426 [Caenorhabditis nigoni]